MEKNYKIFFKCHSFNSIKIKYKFLLQKKKMNSWKIREIFSEDEISEFKAMFEMYDKDSKGYIDKRDLGALMRSLGQNPSFQEINQMIEEVDEDKNGEITFLEFLGLLARRMKEADPEDELLEAFKVFDRDGNGKISAHELRYVLLKSGENFTEQDIEDLIHEADVDGDGSIDYQEFVKIMMSQ